MRNGLRLGVGVLALLSLGVPAAAQDADRSTPPKRPLAVGVCDMPPYSFQQPDGSWDGMAVQLWKIAASAAKVEFQLKPLSIDALDQGLADGTIDIAATGLPVSADRSRRYDFSQPFETAGIVIVTRSLASAGFVDGLRRLASSEILIWLGVILAATVSAAAIVAILERRRNPQFPRGIHGLFEGIWWSITTLSTVGYGDRVPITHRGRLAAAIWMMISFGLMTVLSGIIAANITVGRLNPVVDGPQDLSRHTVGVLSAGAARTLLRDLGVTRTLEFDTPEKGLDAVRDGSIDAFVGESTVLRYLLQRDRYSSLVILPHRLLRTFIALGLARTLPGPVASAIDQSVLETVESSSWSEYLQRLLGGADD